MKPPLLPDEALRRVLRLARFDGTTVLFLSAAFALASASVHDGPGFVIGLLVAGTGAMELHGGSLLRAGNPRGIRWLVTSQVYLLTLVLAYVAVRLQHVNIEPLKPLLTSDQKQAIAQSGFTVDQFLRVSYAVSCGAVALASVAYQGGMAIYYLRRSAAVAAALQGE